MITDCNPANYNEMKIENFNITHVAVNCSQTQHFFRGSLAKPDNNGYESIFGASTDVNNLVQYINYSTK